MNRRPWILVALTVVLVATDGRSPDAAAVPDPQSRSRRADLADSVRVLPCCPVSSEARERWLPCAEASQRALDEMGHVLLSRSCTCDGVAFLMERGGAAPVWHAPEPGVDFVSTSVEPPNIPESIVSLCPAEPGSGVVAILELAEADGFPSVETITPTALPCGAERCFCWGGLPASSGTITLAALGYEARAVSFALARQDERVISGVSLEPGPPFELRILDDRGRPADEAKVAMTWAVGDHSEGLELRIGANGVAALPHFGLGTIDLEFTAPCCAPVLAHNLDLDGLRAMGPVRLPRLGQIAGECHPAEDPESILTGASVCAIRAGERDAQACIETDEDGRFALVALPPDDYSVSVAAEDRPGLVRRGVEIKPGDSVDLGRIAVEPGAVVRLRAVDLESGAPVEGAVVCLEERSAEISRTEAPSETTDESGYAEIGSLVEGLHPFSVTSPRHTPATVELEARIGSEVEQEVLLSVGGRIEGTVLRGGGPAEGDRIAVALRTDQRAAIVNGEGRYLLERLPPGRVAVQRLGHDGKIEMRHAEIRDGETTIVDFGVGTKLSGGVRRATGPVPGAGVVLFRILGWDAREGGAHSAVGSEGRAGGPSSEVLSAVTGLEGEFVFEGLEPGRYSLSVAAGRSLQTRLVDVAGIDHEHVDVPLDTFLIRGRVVSVGVDEEPLPGVQLTSEPTVIPPQSFSRYGSIGGVFLQYSSWPRAQTYSTEDGAFELEVPTAGTWRVSALSTDHEGDSRVVEVGYSTDFVEFRLDRRTTLNVWVEGPAGAPVSGGVVFEFLRDPKTGRVGLRSGPLDPAGRYVLDGTAGTQSWVAASHPAFAPSCPSAVTYPDAGEDDVILALGRGGTLRVASSDGTGGSPGWDLIDPQSSFSLKPLVSSPEIETIGDESFLVFRRLPACPLLLDAFGELQAIRVPELEVLEIGRSDEPTEQSP